MFGIRKVVVGGGRVSRFHRQLCPLRHHVYKSEEALFPNYAVPCAPTEPIEIKKTSQKNALHESSKSFCSDSKKCRLEAENMEKLAIQNFVEDLLDIADALSMVSPICLSFSLIDLTHQVDESAPALYRLLEDVAKTTMQLKKVFENIGVKRFVPHIEEQFDPDRHIPVRRIYDDGFMSTGSVAFVKKPGYMHYDRVLRKSEVWVVVDEDPETEEYNEAKVEENNERDGLENFLKSLLDTADTLIKVSVTYPSIISSTKDIADVLPALQIYLEEVLVAEKKLTEAFKKFGIERFIPRKEPFNPDRHIKVRGESAAGFIKAVLKPGYMLHDRVLRKAIISVPINFG